METQMDRREQTDGRPGSGLAKGLGWFSVGLGIAELAAPRILARAIGIDETGRTPLAMRIMGAREIAAGLGIFAKPQRSLPVWNRVFGDMIDIAFLAYAMKAKRTNGERLVGALAMVLGVTALDIMTGTKLSMGKHPGHKDTKILSVTVNRSLGEVQARWRDVAGDLGKRGTVSFRSAPGGRGTEICLEMKVPSRIKQAVGRLAHTDAEQLADGDLRKVKQLIELGEIVHSDASIHRGTHPAQPAKELSHAR